MLFLIWGGGVRSLTGMTNPPWYQNHSYPLTGEQRAAQRCETILQSNRHTYSYSYQFIVHTLHNLLNACNLTTWYTQASGCKIPGFGISLGPRRCIFLLAVYNTSPSAVYVYYTVRYYCTERESWSACRIRPSGSRWERQACWNRQERPRRKMKRNIHVGEPNLYKRLYCWGCVLSDLSVQFSRPPLSYERRKFEKRAQQKQQ